ncbi:hypothetical protein D9M70_269310 [compost metagenome]
MLLDLSGRRHGQFLQHADGLGDLEDAEMLTAIRHQFVDGGGPLRLEHHEGTDCLAPAQMRQAHHRRIGNGRMAQQDFLDLDGRHVLAAGLDHILLAVQEQQLPVGVEHAQVARVVPAKPAHGSRGVRVLVVAQHDIGPAMHDFASLTRPEQAAVVIHDCHVVDHRGLPPIAAKALELLVRMKTRGDRKHFRLPGAQAEVGTQLGNQALQHGAGHGSQAIGTLNQAGQIARLARGRLKKGRIHQRQAREMRNALALDRSHHVFHVEAPEQDYACAGQQRGSGSRELGTVKQRKHGRANAFTRHAGLRHIGHQCRVHGQV